MQYTKFLLVFMLLAAVLLFACNSKRAGNKIKPKKQALPGQRAPIQKEYYIVTAKSGLTLRKNPGIKSKKILVLPYYSATLLIEKTAKTDTIDKTTGAWFRVSWKGKQGYVFSSYLEEVSKVKNIDLRAKMGNLFALAKILENINTQKAINLYSAIHARSLNESDSPYCLVGYDDYCINACLRKFELKYCRNFPEKENKLPKEETIEYVINKLKQKELNKLKEISLNCIVGAYVCFNCDGGGMQKFEKQLKHIFRKSKYLNFSRIRTKRNTIIIGGHSKRFIPYLKIQLKKSPSGWKIKRFYGKAATYISNDAFCVAGA